MPNVNFINVDGGTDMDVDKFSGLIGLAPTGADSKMASFMSTVLGSAQPKALAELEETVN